MTNMMFSVGLLLSAIIYSASADATADFNKYLKGYWEWRLRDNPDLAVSSGVLEFASRSRVFSVKALDERYTKVVEFKQGLKKISRSALNQADRLSYDILNTTLKTYTDGYKFKTYTYNYINFLEGPHIGFNYLVKLLPFKSEQDYRNYIQRLKGFAKEVDYVKGMLMEAEKAGKTNHNVSMWRVPGQIKSNILDKNYTLTDYYLPFTEKLTNLKNVDENTKNTLRGIVKNVINNEIKPAFQRLADYISTGGYNLRPGLGVSTLPGGPEYYKAVLSWHLSVDMSPEDVHALGLKEVERIKKAMNEVMAKVGFKGTLQEFITHLKNDSRFFLKTEDELINRYKDIIFKRINPTLPKLFTNIPNLPLLILPNPNNGPTAMYFRGTEKRAARLVVNASPRVTKNPHNGPAGMYTYGKTPDGRYQGNFIANARTPDKQPTFDMLALCLHEANPGHHLQISYMLTQPLPSYRQHSDYSGYYQVPLHFPFYTAYTEGWALYAEFLGNELGLYGDPYELFGRYVSEMFRACRLVIDTGLHAKGWTRQNATDYMADHITDPPNQIEVEIDRYVTWPGQACAYKVGEIKIMEMRQKAEKELGKRFDVKEFHSKILNAGAMPLEQLTEIIDDYIKKKLESISAGCTLNPSALLSSTLLVVYFILQKLVT